MALTGTGSVLVTDDVNGMSRSAVAAVRALADAGYRPLVSVSTAVSIAAASRFCAARVQVPAVTDPAYAESLRQACAAHGAIAVLPSSDAALTALELPGTELLDKRVLASRAREAGLDCPTTRSFENAEELREAAASFDYPVVVKPARNAFGASPARRVDTTSSLLEGLQDRPVIVQPWLDDPLRAVSGVVAGGRLLAVVHQRYLRTWPRSCGTASAAVTVERDAALEEQLLQLLAGYDGIFQAQLAGRALLDLNPRVYGSLPLAVAAGANLAAIWCDVVRGTKPATLVVGAPGVHYRWVEGDIRHLIAVARARSLNAGLLSAARPRRATAHSTESLLDPGPFAARVRQALTRAATRR